MSMSLMLVAPAIFTTGASVLGTGVVPIGHSRTVNMICVTTSPPIILYALMSLIPHHHLVVRYAVWRWKRIQFVALPPVSLHCAVCFQRGILSGVPIDQPL